MPEVTGKLDLPRLAGAPAGPAALGQLYYDTADQHALLLERHRLDSAAGSPVRRTSACCR